jgi:hypothetical protein
LHDEDAVDEESNAFRRNAKNRGGVDLKEYEEEMKVFDMEEENSDAEKDGAASIVKKRDQKVAEKGDRESKSVVKK